MAPTLHLLTTASAAAASALFAAVWQGLMLATCGSLCLRLFPRLGAAARSILWMAVFLTVALLHFIPLAHPGISPTALRPPIRLSPIEVSPIWAMAVAAAWLLLSLYRVLRLAGSALRLRRIARQAIPAACPPACAALLQGRHRQVELCTSLDVDRPSVAGFLAPRILLPPALLADLSPFELEQVILHEMEHLRRGDHWTNLVQKLVLTLFPLNPVLLWIERRLCTERELACDDGVLRRTHARKAYATCLTRLAEHSVVRRSLSLALGAWERHSELSQRVYRILRQPEAALAGRPAKIVTGLLTVVLLGGAAELAHSPQLVRFAPQATSAVESSVLLPAGAAAFPAPATHMSLTSAVMSPSPPLRSPAAPAAARLVRTVRPVRPSPRSLQVRVSMRSHLPSRSATVVLTRWEQPPTQTRAQTTSIYPTIWPAYAAVPVGNGWLIIQL
jgi:beta-lactamase regulating signal transducer with metallopeptidase domain